VFLYDTNGQQTVARAEDRILVETFETAPTLIRVSRSSEDLLFGEPEGDNKFPLPFLRTDTDVRMFHSVLRGLNIADGTSTRTDNTYIFVVRPADLESPRRGSFTFTGDPDTLLGGDILSLFPLADDKRALQLKRDEQVADFMGRAWIDCSFLRTSEDFRQFCVFIGALLGLDYLPLEAKIPILYEGSLIYHLG
jgi:hypothetical protein